jgi:MoxR-like ATPase
MTTEDDDLESVESLQAAYRDLKAAIGRTIVGQEEVVEELLVAMFCQGHVILEGAPGLAKTLLVSTLAKCLDLSFGRIQFTPDLMPADVTGTEVLEEDRASGGRRFRFLQGPIFANVVLADEINRAPPKTQAALLEAMQEKQVTVARNRHPLPSPFFVLATQNPIEQEGTYPLPEAQQDRFMFKIFVRYPTYDEEFEIAKRTTGELAEPPESVLTAERIARLQRLTRKVPAGDHVIRYALALVRQTRVGELGVPDWLAKSLSWGAGPRAVQHLLLGAKARALLSGRVHATTEDVAALAPAALRHRLVTNYTAEAEGMTVDSLVKRIIAETPSSSDELARDRRFASLLGA